MLKVKSWLGWGKGMGRWGLEEIQRESFVGGLEGGGEGGRVGGGRNGRRRGGFNGVFWLFGLWRG